MKRIVEKKQRLNRRKMRVRRKITGTAERPRLTVYKSNKNIYAQVIDDVKGHTITSVSTQGGEYSALKVNVEDAAKLGEALGNSLKELKVTEVVFDRNGRLYHGVIKAFADGARKSGIKF
ncbi:LSU ribosomal protein L18p (L5e) [Salinispira pacifica]|uniref:Large ribosomal subunit protein uL18 n=2 Tax=Salinispira pacifica TaxID=1307761 RepID=V5WES5_9SPIO|nr:LSU ribosomal protein L18p (L5e) [Salinispira pacifica]